MPDLIDARFLARPNRFVVRAALDGGTEVDAHLADPGRLRELLVPAARLRLLPLPPAPSRRLRFRVVLVRSDGASGPWVSLETSRANLLARRLLERGLVPEAGRAPALEPEVRSGASRFDFRVRRPGQPPLWIEVKSVTLVEEGAALFPDAPTARGRKHLESLRRIARHGGAAMVIFVVQRPDARRLSPCGRIDPEFAAALGRARDGGVILRAARFRFDAHARPRYLGDLPVEL